MSRHPSPGDRHVRGPRRGASGDHQGRGQLHECAGNDDHDDRHLYHGDRGDRGQHRDDCGSPYRDGRRRGAATVDSRARRILAVVLIAGAFVAPVSFGDEPKPRPDPRDGGPVGVNYVCNFATALAACSAHAQVASGHGTCASNYLAGTVSLGHSEGTGVHVWLVLFCGGGRVSSAVSASGIGWSMSPRRRACRGSIGAICRV